MCIKLALLIRAKCACMKVSMYILSWTSPRVSGTMSFGPDVEYYKLLSINCKNLTTSMLDFP